MTGDPATFDTERTRQHERETIQAHGSLDSEHLLLPIAANELIILQSIAVRVEEEGAWTGQQWKAGG